jgi:hypothetical protein
VSTPEERLRKQAEDLIKNRPETPAQAAARRQQEMEQTAQRLRNVGQKYLARAQGLIAATGMRIFCQLDYSYPGTTRGFRLLIGQYGVVKATLSSVGWQVVTRGRAGGLSNQAYQSDDAALNAKDALLEPLVASAMQALSSGVEQPAPDADGR